MTQKEKLILKFKNNPVSLNYSDIEKLLFDIGFEKINAKGSHMKFKKDGCKSDIIIPVHNNDCKDFYKKLVLKYLQDYNLI